MSLSTSIASNEPVRLIVLTLFRTMLTARAHSERRLGNMAVASRWNLSAQHRLRGEGDPAPESGMDLWQVLRAGTAVPNIGKHRDSRQRSECRPHPEIIASRRTLALDLY